MAVRIVLKAKGSCSKHGLAASPTLPAAKRFSVWCEQRCLADLSSIETVHLAAYAKKLEAELSIPSVKQHLAALKHLFDHLVTGGILAIFAHPPEKVKSFIHTQ